MAINLATKYSNQIAAVFTKASYTAGNYSDDYSFDGVKSVNVWTPQTVELSDYDRTKASDRFGATVEMQDTLQTLTLSQEKGFSISIDRGNDNDQMMTKRSGKMMTLQINEQVVPCLDKYCLKTWADNAGQSVTVAAPTKTNITGLVLDAAAALDNALVPDDNRIIYIPVTNYSLLRQSPEFVGLEGLGVKAISKGEVGGIANMKIVKVPDSYLPDGVAFLATYKKSVLHPVKLQTARILTEDRHVDGCLLQGRWYYDAFVLDAKKMGVYVAKVSGK
jgi:hypothetical protein